MTTQVPEGLPEGVMGRAGVQPSPPAAARATVGPGPVPAVRSALPGPAPKTPGDYVPSLIRTYVPVAIGLLASYLLVHFGFSVDPGAQAGLTALLTALITGVYYAGVRWLERKYPALSFLLGHKAQPVYVRGSIIGDPHVHHGGPPGPPPPGHLGP